MKNANSQLLLGVLGLLTMNSPLLAGQANATSVSDHKMEVLNTASMKSMESSWLSVKPICKARGFNADATAQVKKEARQSIQDIYAAFEV